MLLYVQSVAKDVKGSARNYVYKGLIALATALGLLAGILGAADQVINLGWSLEQYVIAFLLLGVVMLVLLLTFFYKRMKELETTAGKTLEVRGKRNLETLISRDFWTLDEEIEVGRLPLPKGKEIQVHVETNGLVTLTIRKPHVKGQEIEVPGIQGTFTHVFTIPDEGIWSFLLAEEKQRYWVNPFKSEPRKHRQKTAGSIEVSGIYYTS
ncbi:MAG: hypothetical protein ACE5KV_08890 [Thermoplasmata archaeon]